MEMGDPMHTLHIPLLVASHTPQPTRILASLLTYSLTHTYKHRDPGGTQTCVIPDLLPSFSSRRGGSLLQVFPIFPIPSFAPSIPSSRPKTQKTFPSFQVSDTNYYLGMVGYPPWHGEKPVPLGLNTSSQWASLETSKT